MIRRNTNPGRACLAGGVALGGLLLLAPSVRADQLVLVVDEHGHKVYINTGDPAKRPGGRMIRNYSSTLPPVEITHLVEKTANRHEVDPQLVHAIIQVESDYNPKAVSSAGAIGLMQLVPATAMRFGVNNPFDPRQNIEGGVTYLRYLLDLFGGNLALSLAAYNSGENSVLRFGRIPSIPETKKYVRKVQSLYKSTPASGVARAGEREPASDPVRRYIDSQGVVHFTNVE